MPWDAQRDPQPHHLLQGSPDLPWQSLSQDGVFPASSTPGVQRGPLQSTDKLLGTSLWHSTHQEPLHPQIALGHTLSTVSHHHTEACAPARPLIWSYFLAHPSPAGGVDEINLEHVLSAGDRSFREMEP